MEVAPPTKDIYVAASLDEWRRKAIGVYLVASAVVYLPATVLMFLGLHPSFGWQMHAVAAGAYLSMVVAALLRGTDYRVRVWATLGFGYLLAVAGTVAVPHGPFVRVLPVVLPMAALVLVGGRSARVATLVSSLVILFAPLLRAVPALTEALSIDPPQPPEPAGMVLVQGAALIGMLFALMVTLERFHRFLIGTLAAQHQAIADARQEAIERAAAHRALAREMNERRRLAREIARAGDEERRRLGQEVHDGVCQQLTGALLRCQALERHVEKGGPLRREDLSALASLLEEGIDEAHAVARGLWPLEPVPQALAAALRALTKRTQQSAAIRCEFIATGNALVHDPVTAQHLYRIAQEALSNAARHAQASRIMVELSGDDGGLLLQVRDDGVGLPAGIPDGGMGLRTMAYRAQMMDGELTATRATGGGTRVACRVPRYARHGPDDRPGATEERNTSGS